MVGEAKLVELGDSLVVIIPEHGLTLKLAAARGEVERFGQLLR